MQSIESVQIYAEFEAEGINDTTARCFSSNHAVNICLNSNCRSNAFLCIDGNCQCYKQHKACIQGSIQSIYEAIQQKLISIKPFQERINQLIDTSIKHLSQFRKRILINTKKNFELIGLTENERKFIKAIKTNQVIQLTGKQMNQILLSINNVNGFNAKLKNIENRINSYWQTFNKSMTALFFKLQSCLQIFTGSTKLHFLDSSIIKSEDNKQKLLKLFDQKIFVSQLLYRASKHNFDSKVFYDKCKNSSHTLVICETEYGKIIGGYNHNLWKVQNEGTRYGDSKKKSFVFSLTNNHKFTLKDAQYAFRFDSGYGPIFSGNSNSYFDLAICNHANKQRYSKAFVNYGYLNDKYTGGNAQAFQMFSGSKQDGKFLVKDWQVWQLSLLPSQINQ